MGELQGKTELLVKGFKTTYYGTEIPYEMHVEGDGKTFNPRIGEENDATRDLFDTAWKYVHDKEKRPYLGYYLHALDGLHTDKLLTLVENREIVEDPDEVQKAIKAGHLARIVVLHSDSFRDKTLRVLKYNVNAIRLVMRNPEKAKQLFFHSDKKFNEEFGKARGKVQTLNFNNQFRMGYSSSQQSAGNDNRSIFSMILDLIIKGKKEINGDTQNKDVLLRKAQLFEEVMEQDSDDEEKITKKLKVATQDKKQNRRKGVQEGEEYNLGGGHE